MTDIQLNTPKPNSKWKLIFPILLVFVVLAGGTGYAYQRLYGSAKYSNQYGSTKPDNSREESPVKLSDGQEIDKTQWQNTELVMADKLRTCTKYKTQFKHLFTGDLLEKEILGIIDGKCNYLEQMPNNGKMECKYSESERIATAKYYEDVVAAKGFGVSFKADLLGSESSATHTLDGKVVDNPLQSSIDNGVCKISGY